MAVIEIGAFDISPWIVTHTSKETSIDKRKMVT